MLCLLSLEARAILAVLVLFTLSGPLFFWVMAIAGSKAKSRPSATSTPAAPILQSPYATTD